MRDRVRHGIHLGRTDEQGPAIEALTGRAGGAVGVEGVAAGLTRQARPSRLGRVLGRAVSEAYAWDDRDSRDPRWWPQGISSSADASPTELAAGRRLLVTTSYAKQVGGSSHGCRVTFVDLDTLRYEHVLVVRPGVDPDGSPTLEPVHLHAGGIVWHGPFLHLAATARGLVSCRVDDILPVSDPDTAERLGVDGDRVTAYGHRFVLPVRFTQPAGADRGHARFRYSFLALDRSEPEPALVSGEYARQGPTRRLVRYELDPGTALPRLDEDGLARPVALAEGVARMQGAVVRRGQHLVSVSTGPLLPGTVYAGTPGHLRARRLAVPMGPEDLCYWPSTDRVWSVTEHPRRRWFFSMRRSWFD
ncbi:hypothetical protein [Nocardioides euryhalodurans]|uniref:Uncharacterized protein n=1 Tax=Nocardioides euryhalodurans TaxID=2518370 RepID=A0A4P7GNL9_9ACTN|nr:hypothetical protein [Nocardioides euryhalodurans]QBR93680.1 hypothetical protein EXE57_16405 [Nocardioides euryhalodurans]